VQGSFFDVFIDVEIIQLSLTSYAGQATFRGAVDNGAGGSVAGFANFELTLPDTTVPEPVTIALLGTGLLGVGGARMRRRGHRTKEDSP
jgi:hypothetical protein